MDKYCAVIGVDAPSVAWAELEGTTGFRYFTGRILLELDKAYKDGYREFSYCLGNVMDLYLAMEIVGLKKEEPEINLYPYEVDGFDISGLTEYQSWMRKRAILECKTGFMYGAAKTEVECKTGLVEQAGRVIVATAAYYDPVIMKQARAYAEIPGAREFIEIPLVQQLQLKIEQSGINGK